MDKKEGERAREEVKIGRGEERKRGIERNGRNDGEGRKGRRRDLDRTEGRIKTET